MLCTFKNVTFESLCTIVIFLYFCPSTEFKYPTRPWPDKIKLYKKWRSYTKNGKVLSSNHITINTWKIHKPKKWQTKNLLLPTLKQNPLIRGLKNPSLTPFFRLGRKSSRKKPFISHYLTPKENIVTSVEKSFTESILAANVRLEMDNHNQQNCGRFRKGNWQMIEPTPASHLW